MNPKRKLLASFLLLFNGIGAIYGGGNLIMHPDGSSLGITTEWLKYSPFDNFLIPGIILFVVNGLLSLFVLIAVITNSRFRGKLIFAEGVLLCGWILIQMIMLREVNFLHITLGSVGILLVIIGNLQISDDSKTR
ncbi:MAG: hypothetical protein IPI62_00670 [Bacteroidetes bacterium]|nr:hypothetical protein [Bacteroidota bacterium]